MLDADPSPAAPRPPVPRHVACIMDGNGRWARRRGLPRTEGHTAGEANLERIVRGASRAGVQWLTVFGFSTENWSRPRHEVQHIVGLHKRIFARVEEMHANNVRIQWLGRPYRSPGARTTAVVHRAIRRAETRTAGNTGMVFTVAFDYGSRTEIVHAVRRCLADGLDPDALTEQDITDRLYLPELPPVDLLIRTSGEQRISNFLLWQSPGAVIWFTETAWPDFSVDELHLALDHHRASQV